MTPTLTRAVPLVAVTGRTLDGVAYRYGDPQLVTDDGESHYFEQMLRDADKKTIRDRAGKPFELLIWHSRSANLGQLPPESVGDVWFEPDEDECRFRAVVKRSRLGDEMLDMVNDGTGRDVSVGFVPRSTIPGVHDGRRLDSHAEIQIRELSLAPTGTGQYAGAEVLSVRALAAPRPVDPTIRLRLLDL
jgi:hypothetical protein